MTKLVEFSPEMQKKIDSFKALPSGQRVGAYWDTKDDLELQSLKYHIKQHYLHAQDSTCAYCRQKIVVSHSAAWDTDHVIAKDEYPDFMFDPINLCISCKDCNLTKHNKRVLSNPKRKTLPGKPADYLIVHPHLDIYSDNITIVGIAEFYLPRTEKGAKTVEVCGLLRFVYSFSNYVALPQDIFDAYGKAHNGFMSASNDIERAFWLHCINALSAKGCEAIRKSKGLV